MTKVVELLHFYRLHEISFRSLENLTFSRKTLNCPQLNVGAEIAQIKDVDKYKVSIAVDNKLLSTIVLGSYSIL